MTARAPGSGFTLIELLVVVVIIGIVSAVVMLSLGLLSDDRALADQARRLSSLVELAEDEALMQGRDFGLEFMQGGYRFVEYDPLRDQWIELVADDLLRPRQLDEGMRFELVLEDRRVELESEAAEIDDDEEPSSDRDDYSPHVLILSSGDVTPFDLTILRQSDHAEILLAMTASGEFEIETDDPEAP
jgi:general secretion pathway protein H